MEGAMPGAGTAPQQEQPPPEPSTRVLRRADEGRVVFGVAAGLGRYLDLDPVILRIAFVLLTVFGGSGLLLYLVGAIAIPEERPADAAALRGSRRTGSSQDVAFVIGAALIVLGSLSLVGRFLPFVADLVGPVLLLTAGALVIVLGGRR